jgi:CelD/BcsL family acetyltransferase involved in cellulose biosynthesis
MDEIRLSQHVASRIERQWTPRFAQMLEWQRQQPSSLANYDPLRSPQVRRLLEGSLRPPTLLSSQ